MTTIPIAESPSSVGEVIQWARQMLQRAGADAPGLTALTLIEHATGLRRETVLAHPERELLSSELQVVSDLVRRRCAREPLAYLLGRREFYGRDFDVTSATLIPRPETEGLVDLALAHIDRVGTDPLQVLDVGTGTGAIAVTLLVERAHVQAVGTDIDLGALFVARGNALRHQVGQRLHLVATPFACALRGSFRLVVANLPYVPREQIAALEPEIARYEPHIALDGGPAGTEVIRAFFRALPRLVAPGGVAILEFGDGQAAPLLSELAALLPSARVAAQRDAAGLERYFVVERAC